MSLVEMDQRQSHHDNHEHNVAWICIYSNRLECIPTLQGHEHPWSRWGYPPNHV